MKKTIFLLASLLLVGSVLVSCKKDDSSDEERHGEYQEIIPDELAALQSSLTLLDAQGKLQNRLVGVPLDPADETELSVGVDNLDQAKALFRTWFADTTLISSSSDGLQATFTCRQGSARLVVQSNDKGQIAYASFDVPGLQYVSRINFLLNSAWPENAGEKGFHKLGVQYEYNCWTGYSQPEATDWFDQNELIPYVCIREYKNGTPAMLVGIRKDPIFLYWRYSSGYSGRIPGESNAKAISEILRSNWSTYKSYFNTRENILNDGEYYWYDDGTDFLVGCHRNAIRLSDGDTDWFDVHYKEPKKRVFFYILSAQKM